MSEEEFAKLASIQACPNCGEPLQQGYLVAPHNVFWDTKRHKLLPPYGEVVFSDWWKSWTPNAPALRCGTCQIIIFDYEKRKKEKLQ